MFPTFQLYSSNDWISGTVTLEADSHGDDPVRKGCAKSQDLSFQQWKPVRALRLCDERTRWGSLPRTAPFWGVTLKLFATTVPTVNIIGRSYHFSSTIVLPGFSYCQVKPLRPTTASTLTWWPSARRRARSCPWAIPMRTWSGACPHRQRVVAVGVATDGSAGCSKVTCGKTDTWNGVGLEPRLEHQVNVLSLAVAKIGWDVGPPLWKHPKHIETQTFKAKSVVTVTLPCPTSLFGTLRGSSGLEWLVLFDVGMTCGLSCSIFCNKSMVGWPKTFFPVWDGRWYNMGWCFVDRRHRWGNFWKLRLLLCCTWCPQLVGSWCIGWRVNWPKTGEYGEFPRQFTRLFREMLKTLPFKMEHNFKLTICW